MRNVDSKTKITKRSTMKEGEIAFWSILLLVYDISQDPYTFDTQKWTHSKQNEEINCMIEISVPRMNDRNIHT